jgi:hypothetical protein
MKNSIEIFGHREISLRKRVVGGSNSSAGTSREPAVIVYENFGTCIEMPAESAFYRSTKQNPVMLWRRYRKE